MAGKEKYQEAMECVQLGLEAEKEEKYFAAMEFFLKSISIHPTAEGYTYYGWTLSRFRQYRQAIRQCLKAIQLNPDWGNPYNDIGFNLIALHRYDEAIPWLEKALEAKVYAHRIFPYINLARIYKIRGDFAGALKMLSKAREIRPDSDLVKLWIRRVYACLN